MNDHPPLESARLRLEPLHPRHAPALFATFADPEAMQFWTEPVHTTPARTVSMIEQMIGGSERAWALSRKTRPDEAFGLVYYLGDKPPTGMGYIQHPSTWGTGMMSEAVQAALGHGFGPMGLEDVELWIDKDNLRSRRLATRNGFTRNGALHTRYRHENKSRLKLTYGISAQAWRGEVEDFPTFGSVEPILAVKDVRRAAEWYRARLGFRIKFFWGEPPTHAGVTLSPWTAAGGGIQLTQSDEPSSRAALYINVNRDLDELYAQVQARGAPIERKLETMPWRTREFAVRDRDGHLIRFGAST